MAPPSHTNARKQRAMRALADVYLSKQAVEAAGLLDVDEESFSENLTPEP